MRGPEEDDGDCCDIELSSITTSSTAYSTCSEEDLEDLTYVGAKRQLDSDDHLESKTKQF